MVPLPTKRDEAISRLQRHQADLKRLGFEHLYMFSSMTPDEANHDSDVDLFFDYQTGKLVAFELSSSQYENSSGAGSFPAPASRTSFWNRGCSILYRQASTNRSG
jgi:hypothetical protein